MTPQNQQGVCPKCGKMNLTYDTTLNTETGDLVSYNFTCDDCGAKGKEFY